MSPITPANPAHPYPGSGGTSTSPGTESVPCVPMPATPPSLLSSTTGSPGVPPPTYSVTGAPDYGPVAEIQQQTAVGGVVGGTEYDFSFMGRGFAGPGAVAFYEVLWFDGDGSNGGGPQGSATGLQTWTLTENWEMQGMNSLIAPDGADSVLIQIRLVTGAFDGAAGYAGIDAVSMTAIPAPGALALLGLAGIANRRRRG